MNKTDYLEKMNTILNDTTKFKEIKDIDPLLHTLRTEEKININSFLIVTLALSFIDLTNIILTL